MSHSNIAEDNGPPSGSKTGDGAEGAGGAGRVVTGMISGEAIGFSVGGGTCVVIKAPAKCGMDIQCNSVMRPMRHYA